MPPEKPRENKTVLRATLEFEVSSGGILGLVVDEGHRRFLKVGHVSKVNDKIYTVNFPEGKGMVPCDLRGPPLSNLPVLKDGRTYVAGVQVEPFFSSNGDEISVAAVKALGRRRSNLYSFYECMLVRYGGQYKHDSLAKELEEVFKNIRGK